MPTNSMWMDPTLVILVFQIFRRLFGWRFTCNFGRSTLVMAELWGLIHSLKEAYCRGYNSIIVEMDSFTV